MMIPGKTFPIFLFTCFITASALCNTNDLRIVSLAPSNTAIVRDLGLSRQLVGITKFCIRPKNATQAAVIGTIAHPNIELISTLKPALVLGNVESNRIETLDKIESINLPLVRLGPSQSLNEIIRDVNRVAAITNRENAAIKLIENVTGYLNDVQQTLLQHSKKNVFVEIWPKPLTTVSKLGFIHHVVQMAGGKNLFADAPVAYPQISMESVIANNPGAVLILTHSLIDGERIKRYKEFPQLQNAIVHQTDAAELSQPSLSAFVNAVQHFAAVLHPNLDIPTMPPLEDGMK